MCVHIENKGGYTSWIAKADKFYTCPFKGWGAQNSMYVKSSSNKLKAAQTGNL